MYSCCSRAIRRAMAIDLDDPIALMLEAPGVSSTSNVLGWTAPSSKPRSHSSPTSSPITTSEGRFELVIRSGVNHMTFDVTAEPGRVRTSSG